MVEEGVSGKKSGIPYGRFRLLVSAASRPLLPSLSLPPSCPLALLSAKLPVPVSAAPASVTVLRGDERAAQVRWRRCER